MNGRRTTGAHARALVSRGQAALGGLFFASLGGVLSAAAQTLPQAAPTPPPAAQPLLPDWVWMAMLAVVVIGGAIIYLSRAGRRG